jgi:hypothetical protein
MKKNSKKQSRKTLKKNQLRALKKSQRLFKNKKTQKLNGGARCGTSSITGYKFCTFKAGHYIDIPQLFTLFDKPTLTSLKTLNEYKDKTIPLQILIYLFLWLYAYFIHSNTKTKQGVDTDRKKKHILTNILIVYIMICDILYIETLKNDKLNIDTFCIKIKSIYQILKDLDNSLSLNLFYYLFPTIVSKINTEKIKTTEPYEINKEHITPLFTELPNLIKYINDNDAKAFNYNLIFEFLLEHQYLSKKQFNDDKKEKNYKKSDLRQQKYSLEVRKAAIKYIYSIYLYNEYNNAKVPDFLNKLTEQDTLVNCIDDGVGLQVNSEELLKQLEKKRKEEGDYVDMLEIGDEPGKLPQYILDNIDLFLWDFDDTIVNQSIAPQGIRIDYYAVHPIFGNIFNKSVDLKDSDVKKSNQAQAERLCCSGSYFRKLINTLLANKKKVAIISFGIPSRIEKFMDALFGGKSPFSVKKENVKKENILSPYNEAGFSSTENNTQMKARLEYRKALGEFKVPFITNIITSTNIPKERVLFFDDNKDNIEANQMNCNSFLVDESGFTNTVLNDISGDIKSGKFPYLKDLESSNI